MFRFVTVLALLSCVLANTLPEGFDGRIVNGEDTTIEAHPYQVSIQKSSGGHFCGGSIINEDTVVTAAHCMTGQDASNLKIRLGSTLYNEGGEYVSVRAFEYHPGYNSKTKENDIAVIKLATPVRQSAKIRYIALAEKTPATGTAAVVTGWGVKCFFWCISSPTTLQEVKVGIVDELRCASDEYKYGPKVMPTMVCAFDESKDACQGDSGGPLVADDVLVGVVSWGNGCAKSGYPGVYSDVASLRKWVVATSNSL
ncbi:trypsin-like [Teleopsis dalmanni]|uniref:trypsin-like n=1 Tax=Teleopsis dalmanni TaxID=139649 RepID=UPI0018CFAECE|nr:trypsin-like [Teleopsis dalmanni]